MTQLKGSMGLFDGYDSDQRNDKFWNDEALPNIKAQMLKRGATEREIDAGVVTDEMLNDGSGNMVRVIRVIVADGR